MQLLASNSLFEEDIAGAAGKWVADGSKPAGIDSLTIEREVFLFKGGAELYFRGMLDVEFGIVSRIVGPCGIHLGYCFHNLSDNPFGFPREIALKSAFFTHYDKLLILGNWGDLKYNLLGSVFRVAAWTRNVPERSKITINSADIDALASPTPHAILKTLKLRLAQRLITKMEHLWRGVGVEERIRLIFAAFDAHTSATLGLSNWPVRSLHLPDVTKSGFDLTDTVQRSAVVNVLQHIYFNALIYEINEAQEALIKSSLIDLGVHDDRFTAPAQNAEQDDLWVGSTVEGRAVYVSSTFRRGLSRVSVVSIVGGAPIGTAVYKINQPDKPWGRIAASLWSLRNHTHYFLPEEIRGIGLLVAQ
jgi:hypothetical protein